VQTVIMVSRFVLKSWRCICTGAQVCVGLM